MRPALDTTALTAPFGPEEERQLALAAKADRPSPLGLLWRALGAGFLALVFTATFLGVLDEWVERGPWPAAFFLLVLCGMAAFVVAISISSLGAARRRRARHLRLERFARDNRLYWMPEGNAPQYPGTIFSVGTTRLVRDRLFAGSGEFFDVGVLQAVTGSGKERRTVEWSYLALRLTRDLPHLVLDSTRDNVLGQSSLPETMHRAQRLSLEGDFDRHFALYCPAGYERDALYVFTPDLMALLIDEAGDFDVEIVDDRMTLFTRRSVDPLDPETWRRYERIMELVLPKARRQTRRYRDERADAGETIALEGRRLRTGVPWSGLAIGVGVLAGWVVLRFVLGGG
ncbi:DUF3137 domain-containing protein [Agromyces mediolanus]|uniref:DUF3137 domain-containing protein n=1 Tax=Agromyces mediolanus TaxID=41986 RepID=UPI001E58683D|nr:DUF3137 domain-containing protein [Agromyces mediolanus]MCD1569827.1 DUF3137 domain-containing protein [Agromyces mediolanus]